MKFKVTKKQINHKIKETFVNREVLACVTNMVNYILQQDDLDAPFSYDDVENYFMPICPKCHSNYGFKDVTAYKCESCDEIYEEKPETCKCFDPEIDEEKPEFEEITAYKCMDCGHIVEDVDELDNEPQEVYEWWLVTSFLGEKLKEHGEVILNNGGDYIWGRCTTGQAIMLDNVISDICADMEILDGQRYSWADKI